MGGLHRVMSDELFVELWNEIGDLGQIARRCGRSKISVFAKAEQLASKGYELREIEGSENVKHTIYLPSPEQIKLECLKIRARKGDLFACETVDNHGHKAGE